MNYEVVSLVASLIAAVALPLAGVLAAKLADARMDAEEARQIATKANRDANEFESANNALLETNADLQEKVKAIDIVRAALVEELKPLREKEARRQKQPANRARAAAKTNGTAHA